MPRLPRRVQRSAGHRRGQVPHAVAPDRPVPRALGVGSLAGSDDPADLADQVPSRHRAPLPGVARLCAVVAQEEVLALGDVPRPGLRVSVALCDVGLLDGVAVDEDVAVSFGNGLTREAYEALDEDPA